MISLNRFFLLVALSVSPVLSPAQSLDPSQILKPAPDSWPTYSGDYSGRRYSPLTQINQSNVKDLSLAWASRIVAGSRGPAGTPPVIVSGEGTDVVTPANIKGAILQVDGVLYVTSPDNAWAMDARDGHEIWHFYWKTKGGTHIGNRGLAMWGNWLYMETPDDYLICLDAKTGKERWHKEIANFNQQYFSTMSPVVVGNHILIGTGNDLDEPGYIQSRDPETGDMQWMFYTVPMKASDPGANTWGSLDGAKHGAGNVWIPG